MPAVAVAQGRGNLRGSARRSLLAAEVGWERRAVDLGGVWWVWLSTRRVPWVRSLALGIVALAVLVNGYSDLFGDHWGNAWRTINPLFIGSSSVAAVALWRSGHAAGQVGAVVSAALGALVFANAYFVDNGVIWQILNPVRMLTALAWAAAAGQANVGAAASSEPAGDG